MFKSIVGLLIGVVGVSSLYSGYNEVTVPSGKEFTAIVCEVIGTDDGLYIPCENVYNSDDVIWIDKVYGEKDELLHVTFEHDDVYDVKEIEDYKLIVK